MDNKIELVVLIDLFSLFFAEERKKKMVVVLFYDVVSMSLLWLSRLRRKTKIDVVT